MVCPVCGGKSEVDVFCRKCLLEKKLRIGAPRSLCLAYCKRCGKVFKGKHLLQDEDAISAAKAEFVRKMASNLTDIEQQIGQPLEKEFTIEPGEKNSLNACMVLKLGGFSTTIRAVVKLTPFLCPDCSRMSAGYYEALLQIRGRYPHDIIDKISRIISSTGGFITQVGYSEDGIDIYVSSKKAAELVLREYAKSAEITKSRKQYGLNQETSKALFKFNYCLRFPG